MKALIRKYPAVGKYMRYILFIAVGAMLGFIYWRFVGCRTGSCPITASWHTSVLFGSLIGLLAVPSGKKKEETTNSHNNED